MSTNSSSTAAITAATTMVVRYNVQFASLALLYYDYSLTWTREVKYFWRRKPNLSTLLYVCCRYALVANVIYTFAMAGELKYMSCDAAYQLCSALSQLGRFGILTVWGARTYAVFDRNKWILAFFTVMGFFVMTLSVLHVPYVSCSQSKGLPLGIPHQLLAIMTATFESIAAIFTTVRVYQTLRLIKMDSSKRKSLSQVILEQGSLYIGFVSLFSVGTIILLNMPATKGTFFERLLNALTIPVSGLMTCRFLLYLREWENMSTGAYSTNQAMVSIPLQFHEDIQDEDELDDSETVSSWSDEVQNDPLFNVTSKREISDTCEEPIGLDRV